MSQTTNFLYEIGPELTQELAHASTLMKYTNDQIVHSRGAIKPGLSVVKSGSVNVGIFGVDGKFIPIAILGSGECFGEFTLFVDLPRTHDIHASGNTELYQLNSVQFNRLSVEHPEIIKALLKINLLRNHNLLEMLDSIRRLPLLERTASTLNALLNTSNSQSSISCTQDQLAFNLGVSRVSVGKALRILEQQGLIQIGYRKIDFPSLYKFKQWLHKNCNYAPLSSD
jgi:CRP-like cAMP-binding protein